MGRHTLDKINENGELFAEFCAFQDLIPHKHCHKVTWVSSDRVTEN
jgi:hypothetical protein